MSHPYTIDLAGDSAMVLAFEARIDRHINEQAVQVAGAVRARAAAGVRDVVPAFHAVTVHFDPVRTDVWQLRALLEGEARRSRPAHGAGVHLRIPVCYGDAYGPDLPALADWAGLSADEVVERHAGTSYRVYMLGFVPGFAYLGTVDGAIAMPRHAAPRVRVAPGSVGIAGAQTGVYPVATPGGWQLIGRTPIRMFEAARQPPSVWGPGDTVTFYRIDPAEYRRQIEGQEPTA